MLGIWTRMSDNVIERRKSKVERVHTSNFFRIKMCTLCDNVNKHEHKNLCFIYIKTYYMYICNLMEKTFNISNFNYFIWLNI